jgi:hypothetical protein
MTTSIRLDVVDDDGAELWIDAVNSNGDHHVLLANLTRLDDKWWSVTPVESAFLTWWAQNDRGAEAVTMEKMRHHGANFLSYLQSLKLCMGYVEV